jgi:hypothetical protein
LSDATLTRATAIVLWLLIFLAAVGGIAALLRSPSSGASDSGASPAATDHSQSRFVASGFAERYVTAYLEAGRDGSKLVPYLGYTPELPGTAQAGAVSATVRTVDVTEADDDYWAVTVAVGSPGAERFWRAAVEVDKDFDAVAVGLPAAVAAPPDAERVKLGVTMAEPPADDPVVDTVTGFLSSYLCGQPDLSRYLSPGTSMTAVDPAVCDTVEIVRWGATPDEDGHQTVVVDAQLEDNEARGNTRIATYSAAMTRRDGRWEIAELLPAPPRDSDKD